MLQQLVGKFLVLFFVLLSPVIGHSQTATECYTKRLNEKKDNLDRSNDRVGNGLYMCTEQFGNDGERFGDDARRIQLKQSAEDARKNYEDCLKINGILSDVCQNLSKISFDAYKLFVDNSGGYTDCEIATREDARRLFADEERAADEKLSTCLKDSTRFNNLTPLKAAIVSE